MASLHLRISLLVGIGCCALAACAAPQPAQVGGMSSSTRLQIAEAAERGGNANLALAMYSAMGETSGDAKAQLRAAEGLARNGKFDLAEQTLKQALKRNAGQPDLLRALGQVQVVSGKPGQAIVSFDAALVANPKDARSLVDKAVALDLLQRHAEAQVLYQTAMLLMPDDPEIRSNLALSMMLQGRVGDARATLAPVDRADPLPDRVKGNLGVIYAASGEAADAQRMLGDSVSPEKLLALTNAIAKAPVDGAIQ